MDSRSTCRPPRCKLSPTRCSTSTNTNSVAPTPSHRGSSLLVHCATCSLRSRRMACPHQPKWTPPPDPTFPTCRRFRTSTAGSGHGGAISNHHRFDRYRPCTLCSRPSRTDSRFAPVSSKMGSTICATSSRTYPPIGARTPGTHSSPTRCTYVPSTAIAIRPWREPSGIGLESTSVSMPWHGSGRWSTAQGSSPRLHEPSPTVWRRHPKLPRSPPTTATMAGSCWPPIVARMESCSTR